MDGLWPGARGGLAGCCHRSQQRRLRVPSALGAAEQCASDREAGQPQGLAGMYACEGVLCRGNRATQGEQGLARGTCPRVGNGARRGNGALQAGWGLKEEMAEEGTRPHRGNGALSGEQVPAGGTGPEGGRAAESRASRGQWAL